MSSILPSGPALIVDELSVRYPRSETDALERVSLRVSAGEIVALAGPNGCGKTTLLRAATGMLAPASGCVRVSGMPRPMHRLPPVQRARLVAVVPQMAKLPSGFTAAEAVMLSRISYHGWFGPETEADIAAVQSALETVGLASRSRSILDALSGGEQQRIWIARALAQEAPILLLDEPTAHLDPRYQLEILALLHSFARSGRCAALIAIHDLNLASSFADRIALLDRGRLAACGSPAEVLTGERLSALYSIPMHVIPHPFHGRPLVLPDGDERSQSLQPGPPG
jgi:ABC-type cobalamin/Fe3+-siderophores transport system ATPase subunit